METEASPIHVTMGSLKPNYLSSILVHGYTSIAMINRSAVENARRFVYVNNFEHNGQRLSMPLDLDTERS